MKNEDTIKPPGNKSTQRPRVNIIYFVESEKTKTLSFSILTIQLYLFSLIGLVTWFFASIYIINHFVFQNRDFKNYLTNAQNVIFKFETEYNDVFENIYSKEKTKKQLITTIEKTKENIQQPKLIKKSLERIFIEQETSVEIENPSFKTQNDNLVIHFAIRNKKNSQKSEGFLWATMELELNKNISFLTSPSKIPLDANGYALDVSKYAKDYSIRHYKVDSFTFPLNELNGKKIKRIKIYVQDEKSAIKGFLLPIQILYDDVVSLRSQIFLEELKNHEKPY